MNYTSFLFWLLFAGVFAVYWRVGHRAQNRLLLVASYVFYGAWDYRFLFLLLISTAVDYVGGLGVAGTRVPRERLRHLTLLLIGSAALLCSNIRYGDLLEGFWFWDVSEIIAALPRGIGDLWIPIGTAAVCGIYGLILPRLYELPESKRRKTFLVISLAANLAILGFFKYFDFFVSSMVDLLGGIGLGGLSWGTLGIILPAGISFYTFQAMSYTIDIYRGHAEPTEDFADFALFVAFFPHLVAGPIMRAETLLPQVTNARKPDREEFREGALLIAIGFFKKVVIADNMAPMTNAVFLQFQGGQAAAVSGAEVLVALYAFAFQIYGDFSGYSAIARGVSKLLGFELVINFRLPYLAVSPSDFWRRWHISLSTWLRDYVYFPIGGSRRGIAMTCRNLLFTMFLSGLWHGASWTTVVWGIYWGVLMSFFALLRIPDPEAGPSPISRINWLLRVAVMFHLTCLGWLLFRADTLATAYSMLMAMLAGFHLTSAALAGLALVAWYCALLSLIELMTDGEEKLGRVFSYSPALQSAVYLYLFVMIAVFPAERAYDFIYFQF